MIGPKLFRNKNYKWITAAEIIDTGKLYAQCVAKIDIKWVEKLALHLVDFEYSNPRWNKKLSRVDATQKTLLYGFTINPGDDLTYQRKQLYIYNASPTIENLVFAPASYYLNYLDSDFFGSNDIDGHESEWYGSSIYLYNSNGYLSYKFYMF